MVSRLGTVTMQQPLAPQPDQMGTQQTLGQQMVLCPVRLVYETQILVQPGDHIQPNQTFFINPQNPPPWMQNSLQNSLQPRQPIQNQVVYVHQLPNNIVSSIQQPMDQNQLYLQQNYPNFQLQQQMLTQNPQEMRSAVQLTNIMPNMVQSMQQNVPNERTVQNRPMQANPQMIQNQISVNRPIQHQMGNPTLEVQGQVVMRPQMHQQGNIQRSVMNVNQMQNLQHQNLANLQNVVSNTGQNFLPNTGRPGSNMNTVRTSIPNNVVNVAAVPKVREITPLNVENKTVNSPIGNVAPNVRNFVPNYYRPIQPRPQIGHNTTNMPKVQQHIPVQTIQNSPVYDHSKNNNLHNTNNNFAIIQELNNPIINKKRKSESPDETQRKLPTPTLKPNYNTQAIPKPNYNHTQESISKPHYYTVQQNMNVTKLVSEMGTNTSPVHRPKLNPQIQINSPQINKPAIEIEPNINKDSSGLQDKEKLIRNTVFTQARGRVLQDKIDESKPQQMEIATETTEQVKIAAIKAEPALRAVEEQPKPAEIPKAISDIAAGTDIIIKIVKETNKNEKEVEINLPPPKTIKIEEKQVEKIKQLNKTEQVASVSEQVASVSEQVASVSVSEQVASVSEQVASVSEQVASVSEQVASVSVSEQVASVSEKVASDNEKMDQENDEQLLVSDRNTIKQEKIDILTHVVDGYVIQESNIAFPIRKPLKEKILYTNTKSEENEKKDLLRESIKEELKSNAVDIPLLPFHYLLLESAKEEKEKAEEREKEEAKVRGNPFSQLEHTTVKSWTVDDLTAHLLKFSWKDTVSLLQDHEIDGESLYLVSKQQLLTIGVTEEHADVICEFVKS
ncbi:unnamed protein product [Arctia plantaginis]|uniref:SAM domain-containing protein n=1 Tax=Arctia plantaginis TaxID=874455 RepID=A0A8S1BU76_ARCPL|nr:unnamed protein product [Arctia plantaginis]